MALIDDELAAQLKQEFQGLVGAVRLTVFSQALQDPGSGQVARLVSELCALDPRLGFEDVNFVLEKDRAEALGITRTPAILIAGAEKDYGVRMYGMPSGYEFGSLVDAILSVSKGTTGLAEETRAALARVDRPVKIQVFSTPTCPYCPRAVRLAFDFALESDHISADSVEVTGYPELAQRYRVSGVPKTVVNDEHHFVGAQDEATLLRTVQEAIAAATAPPTTGA